MTLLEAEGSSDPTIGLDNEPVPEEASNRWTDEYGYVSELMVERENERTEAVYSNTNEIEDLDDWDDEEDQEAAADEHGNASSNIPFTESHEVFTEITGSGDKQFFVHDENTNEHEGVYDGRRPSHEPPVYMAQDHGVVQTYDVVSAGGTLPGEDRTPTGTSEAEVFAFVDNESYQDASEPSVKGPIGSGKADTVNLGASFRAITNNEAGEATKPAGIEDTKETTPSVFFNVAASDKDETIVGDEKLPGDVLNHSTSNDPSVLASAVLKRPRNASEDETPTGADLHGKSSPFTCKVSFS